MIVHVVQTQDGSILKAFISEDKANTMADRSPDWTVDWVVVEDAQDNPVRG